MGIDSVNQLLDALLKATTSDQVNHILAELGDGPDVDVDEPFGALGCQWHFFDDNSSNMSTINLGSKPGHSLTERVTNAIDAVFEREMLLQGNPAHPPGSPLEAADAWFDRPWSTAGDGLFNMDPAQIDAYSRWVQIVMLPGEDIAKPTVDVVDQGIGMEPDEFTSTILSFHRGNKINKLYLAGAFGQGGSATIAFSDYTLILSRHLHGGNTVGFTLVKQMDLDEIYKENAYVFLAVPKPDGTLTVPGSEVEGPIEAYPGVKSTSSHKPQAFTHGTIVRHYGYQARSMENPLSSSPGNMYHLMNYMLFDPVLPFRVVDLRQPGHYRSRVVIGSRNRLLADGGFADVRHHQPRFWLRPTEDSEQTLGVEYWVVFSSHNKPSQNGNKPTQRVRPHDLFLDPAHPIIGTLNGQNHGELTPRIIREARLPQVAKHIIVHLDLTVVSKRTRSQLLSSTREGFKEGEVFDEVVRILQDHLRDDEHLHEIEAELEESLLERESTATTKEVRNRITRLLREFKIDFRHVGDFPGMELDGTGNPIPRTRKPPTRRQPLDTLPYPDVTRLEIVSPQKVLRIHQGDSRFVKVETNADRTYDKIGAIKIRTIPDHLDDVSKGPLIGGRINWRLRPRKESKPGDIGRVLVSLTLPNGEQIVERMPYEILPPREEKIKTPRGYVPYFDVQGLDPFDNPDQFFRVWDYLDPEEDDITQVAYKVIETRAGLIVYYSKAFGIYRSWLQSILERQPSLVQQFTQNYEIWIGYYAISQWQQRKLDNGLPDFNLEEELLERMQDRDGAIVAEMQVKQALEVADLQRKFANLT